MMKIKAFLKKIGLWGLVSVCVKAVRTALASLNGLRFYMYNYCISFIPCHVLRKSYLVHILGIKIGRESFVHMGCYFAAGVTIGNNSVIGRSCTLLGNITVKDNVSITAKAYIFSSSHHKDSASFEAYIKPVVIEDYAWIGAQSIIQPGVNMGRGSVLAAGSVATRNVSDFTINGGVPAKVIGTRDRNLNYKLRYFPFFE